MNHERITRLGLIGAGGIAQAYSQAFEKLTDVCQLVAVADVQSDRAEAMASKHNGVPFACHRQMLLDSELDGVIVCTPPAMHPEHCHDALNAKIHTLCEKPVAMNVEAAEKIIETARRHATLFTMASKFRFVPDLAVVKKMIADGDLGQVVLFENVFASHVDMSQRWNSNPKLSGGGVLIDNGTHSLDIMQHMLGPLAEIHVVEGKRVQAIPVEDTVHIFAKTASGVLGSIDLSWSINKQSPFFINIYGSLGTAQIGWRGSQYKLNGQDEWTVFGQGYDKVQAFCDQIRNFCLAIHGHEALIVTPAEALASVQAVAAAYKSLAVDQWELITN